jgi:peptidoglycan/xylan/chitin deacetylase (PgdA/CDA1 family)
MTLRLLDRIFPQWLWRLPNGDGQIALTFDDGPDPNTTPALLETLAKLDVRATFFIVGSKIEGNSGLLKRAVIDGHVLANHGYHHANHALYSRAALRSSIQRTEEAMTALDVQPLRLFRPPYGFFRPGMASELTRLGYRGIMWTAHLRDWKPQSAAMLERRAGRAFDDGSIILLHDSHAAGPQSLSRILTRLAADVRERGFHFVTLQNETLDQSLSNH